MIASAQRVIAETRLDDAPFNMEFFYHESRDAISLLEINARISKSHSPLFDKVEGVPHKEVMLDVALGRRPDYPARRGAFRYAAKFMPRLYGDHDDAVVRHVPDAERLREIAAAFPGSEIQLHVTEGLRLERVSPPRSLQLRTCGRLHGRPVAPGAAQRFQGALGGGRPSDRGTEMSDALHVLTEFPRPVRAIENIWIPMRDGARLAARLWLPEDAEADPVPAILEYIPYRKRDFTRQRDSDHAPLRRRPRLCLRPRRPARQRRFGRRADRRVPASRSCRTAAT